MFVADIWDWMPTELSYQCVFILSNFSARHLFYLQRRHGVGSDPTFPSPCKPTARPLHFGKSTTHSLSSVPVGFLPLLPPSPLPLGSPATSTSTMSGRDLTTTTTIFPSLYSKNSNSAKGVRSSTLDFVGYRETVLANGEEP